MHVKSDSMQLKTATIKNKMKNEYYNNTVLFVNKKTTGGSFEQKYGYE